MEFFCFKCDKTFTSGNETIKHLKKNHFMVDNVEPIKCVFKQCAKRFNTFKGLSYHIKSFDHGTLANVCFQFIRCTKFRYFKYNIIM